MNLQADSVGLKQAHIWFIIYYLCQKFAYRVLNLTSKLPEDGGETPKHVETFVI
jgi:hypothetical protein